MDSYVRARPGYPAAALAAIEAASGAEGPLRVADVGAGTGIFTRQLLERGHSVIAVEPNDAMRAAAEAALGGEAGFRSVAGRAEATTLPDASVDLVVAAQAFHWFDVERTREEWRRILRPPHRVALLWNDRRLDPEGFDRAYEDFLEYWGGEEYQKVRKAWQVESNLPRFFGPQGWREHAVPNAQRLDLPGLEARLLSSSYLPGPADPRRQPLLDAAAELFARWQQDGTVVLDYQTHLYLGCL